MKLIKLSLEEFFMLLNMLNEICNDVYVNEFEKVIGKKKEDVSDFFNNLLQVERLDEMMLELNNQETDLLRKVFDEVLRQIEEWEFETRIGATIDEIKAVGGKIYG